MVRACVQCMRVCMCVCKVGSGRRYVRGRGVTHTCRALRILAVSSESTTTSFSTTCCTTCTGCCSTTCSAHTPRYPLKPPFLCLPLPTPHFPRPPPLFATPATSPAWAVALRNAPLEAAPTPAQTVASPLPLPRTAFFGGGLVGGWCIRMGSVWERKRERQRVCVCVCVCVCARARVRV